MQARWREAMALSEERFLSWVSAFSGFGAFVAALVFGAFTIVQTKYAKRADLRAGGSSTSLAASGERYYVPRKFWAFLLAAAACLYWPPVLIAIYGPTAGPPGPIGEVGPAGPPGATGAKGEPGIIPGDLLQIIDALRREVVATKSQSEAYKSKIEDLNLYAKIDLCKAEIPQMIMDVADNGKSELAVARIGMPSYQFTLARGMPARRKFEISDIEKLSLKCLGSDSRPRSPNIADEQLDAVAPDEPTDRPQNIRQYRRAYVKMQNANEYAQSVQRLIQEKQGALKQRIMQ